MSKIKLNACLKSTDETIRFECLGLYSNSQIQYLEQDIHVTLLINMNTITLKRCHNTYKIELLFDLNGITKGVYTLSEYQQEIPLSIKTKQLDIAPQRIYVNYVLLDDENPVEYEYELKYEVIE